MHKYAKAVVISLLLCASLLVQTGCLSEPRTIVNSLDQIKQDLSDQPDVCYPDLSNYDQSQFLFKTSLYLKDRKKYDGYEIGANTASEERLSTYSGSSTLSNLGFRCTKESLYEGKLNSPLKELEINTYYRGIPMEAGIWDISGIIERNIERHKGSWVYPTGTRSFACRYEFSLNDYQYIIEGQIVLTPERLAQVDIDEEIAKADAEVRSIVDGMLDQGGVPR